MRIFHFLAAAAAAGGIAAPLAAQSSYPYQNYPVQQVYPNQQVYPQAVPQPYPGQPGYGYNQGYNPAYGNEGSIGQIINQLLGNRYSVSDRTAVGQCANAAMVQAQSQYRGNYGGQYRDNRYGYNQDYGYNQGFAGPAMRVTAITSVERRQNGLRVKGLMSSGHRGQGYGYQGQGYAQADLSFRCNVDYRGYVSNVRINRNDGYRG
jgi:hypothetical protein